MATFVALVDAILSARQMMIFTVFAWKADASKRA